jgi:hypothetical protein
MQKEKGIRFEDCHVGDVFRLKTRCPFVYYYLISEGIAVAIEDKVTARVVHKERDTLDVMVYVNGKRCATDWDCWLASSSIYREHSFYLNVDSKINRKNNYY